MVVGCRVAGLNGSDNLSMIITGSTPAIMIRHMLTIQASLIWYKVASSKINAGNTDCMPFPDEFAIVLVDITMNVEF